jgi:chromosome segregation ATPase
MSEITLSNAKQSKRDPVQLDEPLNDAEPVRVAQRAEIRSLKLNRSGALANAEDSGSDIGSDIELISNLAADIDVDGALRDSEANAFAPNVAPKQKQKSMRSLDFNADQLQSSVNDLSERLEALREKNKQMQQNLNEGINEFNQKHNEAMDSLREAIDASQNARVHARACAHVACLR